MKIMHVLKKYPNALGGDAVVVSNLQKQQEAANHDISIVTSNCDEIVNGAHIYKCGLKDTASGLDNITFKRLLSLIILCVRMFGILKKERPNIVHTHSIDMAFFVSLAARFYNIPIIHTFHIVTFYDSSQSLLRRKSELWLARHSHFRAITAPNNFDVRKLRTAGLAQATLLPNGVDVGFWARRKQLRKGQEFVFLTVGRLEKQKGYDYLIKASALLAKKAVGIFRVIIVGEGSQNKVLRRLVRSLRITHIVQFVGKKNPQDIRGLAHTAHAAVVPSLYETTPVTILEAWAAHLPVIASSVGILRDLPTDSNAAFIVPPKDEQALMQSMFSCMHNVARRTAIAAKGNDEVKKYTWPAIAQAAEAVYGRL